MIFIDPSLEEVYQTLVDNDEIINFLKQENLILTKSSLAKENGQKAAQEMGQYIYANNSAMLYQVAQVLLTYKDKIKSMSIRELLDEMVAWDKLADALGIGRTDLTRSVYINIMYTYKYCYTSSFFQNNKDRFIPENDFYEMEKNPAAMAFYDAMMKEFDKLDYILSKTPQFLEYDKIPWDLMTYLTQLLGLEKSTFELEDKDENKFREIAKNILDIYRIKGTNYSFELFFNFLGYNIKIHEYYFDRRLYYSNLTGNIETDSDNAMNYEYYLTTLNPTENMLEDLSINEIVLPSDISPQYSLDEFNDLIKDYGAEAVLGYSPIYKTTENGKEVYKEYKGNVYKYFKTNYIYYEIKLPVGNISARQYKTIVKCLDFLTPSYVKRKSVKTEAKAGDTADSIGFDGDGSKKPDENGNYGKIEILDSEDWSNNFKNSYVTSNKDGILIYQPEPGVENKYFNSLYDPSDIAGTYDEGVKFRLPLKFRAVNTSINRYLTGSLKTPYVKGHRVKYFIDGNNIYPYFTVPPFTESSNPKGESIIYSYPNELKEISLTGAGNTVKSQIKNANVLKPIKYICKNLNDIKDTLDKLEPSISVAKTLINIATYSYNTENKKILYNNLQKMYNFCNYSDDISKIDNSSKIEKIDEYYKNTDIYEKFIYGRYIIGDSGSSFKIYRFGNYKMPIDTISKSVTTYNYDYDMYVNSFSYKPIIENDNVKRKLNLNTRKLVIEKENIKEIEKDIEAKWKETKEKKLELKYVTSNVYFNMEDRRYYRPIRTTYFESFFIKDEEKKGKIFQSQEMANEYYLGHPEEIIKNNEYFIFGEKQSANKGLGYGNLYSFWYANRNIGDLIYTTDDGKLYTIDENYNIKEVKDFFGKLELYKDNTLLNSIPENLEGVSAKINLYDKDWFGYDEQADSEDFIFYNSSHKIQWEGVIDDPIKIDRPIKYNTDKEYYKNNLISKLINEKLPKTYIYFGASKLSNYDEDYILVKDLKVSPKGYGLYIKDGEEFTKSLEEEMIEGTNYYTKTSKGIINCIESNIENITEVYDGGVDYYSSIESFLIDYHKIIINNNFALENFSNRFKEEFKPGVDGYSEKQINIIKKNYNNAILQIYCLSNSFIDNLLKKSDVKIGLDDYGFNMDIFSEFRDIIQNFAYFLTDGVNKVDDYFKDYYYRTLVELYRESYITDNDDLGVEMYDNKPMFILLNNLEKLDGKSGKLLFPTTLLSSSKMYDNGLKNELRIPFNNIFVDLENSKIKIKVDHNEVVRILGKDPESYYKFLSLKLNNFTEGTEEYDIMKKELDERYSDYLNCIKPTFYYKDKNFYNNKEITSWQKNKKALEVNYFNAVFKTYDNENYRLFDDKGNVIDKGGIIIEDQDQIKDRINNGYKNGYSIIELTHNINDLDVTDANEINNIEGYLTVKKFNQNFLDNRLSFPKSDDWIKKDYYNNAIEYCSIMDDRDFQYYKTFKYYDKNPNYCKCRAFINKNGKVVLKFKENNIDNNLNINTMQIDIS